MYSLPQQFEDSLVMRKFQGVHDENTRPAERADVMVSMIIEITKDSVHHTGKI